ncbi:MAG TPA: DUF6174 domain-containing protein [Anaerolineae bacterium]|nr:DUF6174 domain-containing protein [Anaerolineae bacterium]
MSQLPQTATARRILLWSILGVMLPVLAACGAGPVGRAETRWEAAGAEAYRFHLREFRSVWCVYEVDLVVQGSQVMTATVTARPGPAQGCWDYTQGVVERPVALSPEEAPTHWTIPGIFEIARDWQEQAGQKGLRVELEFDPELGYPLRIYRDNEAAYDDDWGLSISKLEILAGGAAQ